MTRRDPQDDRVRSAREVHDRYLRASSVGRVPPPRSQRRRRWTQEQKRVAWVALLLSVTSLGLAQQRHARSIESTVQTAAVTAVQPVRTDRAGTQSVVAASPASSKSTTRLRSVAPLRPPLIKRRPLPSSVLAAVPEHRAPNEYLVIVYSTANEREARAYLREHRAVTRGLRVIQSNTGFYGVALGAFDASAAKRARSQAIRDDLARDAYLMHRNRVVRWLGEHSHEAVSEHRPGAAVATPS